MASIEYITKRLEGKKAEIDKLEKKLERINKAEASGWEDNPYYYSESDKRWTLRDLEDAKKALCDWGEKLAQAEEKAASRNVPAILQFLEMWKARCFDHFEVAIREAAESRKQLVELCAKMDRVAYGTPERQDLRGQRLHRGADLQDAPAERGRSPLRHRLLHDRGYVPEWAPAPRRAV